ncbi:hypothetical protein ACSBR2_034756 [Camellia fascicularis]
MADHKPKSDISFAGTFASSAFAACFVELCTIPLDTAKVRLQLQKNAVAGDGLASLKYGGMLGTVATIAREEGLSALWKGIVKKFYMGDNFVGDVPLSKKILAALTTGAIAITVANPTDLVKVRLQAKGKLPPGVPRRYSGAFNAYYNSETARNAIINAAELASYDQVKRCHDSMNLGFVFSMQTLLKIPGFTDNVKSRMMGDSTYKSTLDCFIKTLKSGGPLAFYKGFIPNFGRLGSWNVIMFLTLEQAKKFVRSTELA